MQIRPIIPTDLDGLREIDGTVESSDYLHVEQSGEGISVGWKLEKRPLREKLIASNPLSDETQFAAKQLATGADEGLALVVEHENLPVGLLIAQPRYDQHALEVIDLRIDYEHRRQGLATAMIYQAINFARERELRAVMVQTRTNNLPASQFLLKTSFDLAGIDTRRHSNHDLVKESATLMWYAALD
jgi:ribosomal protein S18 acetylase RimI-like enzyme